MKTLFKIMIIGFLFLGCTKPKETCVPVHLNVVSRQDWNTACGCWQNTYIDTIVYLEEIGTFKNQSEIDSYPHLANTQVGDPKYKDLNGDGKINESDHCN